MGNIGALSSVMTGIKMGATVASGIGNMIAGSQAKSLYNQEASATEQEGELLRQDAENAAKQKAREAGTFQSNQVLQYLNSGVSIEGSPIQVLEKTRSLAQEEVDSLIKRGDAQKQLAMIRAAGIRATGAQAASQGRAAMFGSLFTAAGQGIEGYIAGKRNGIYGSTLNPPPPVTPVTRTQYGYY